MSWVKKRFDTVFKQASWVNCFLLFDAVLKKITVWTIISWYLMLFSFKNHVWTINSWDLMMFLIKIQVWTIATWDLPRFLGFQPFSLRNRSISSFIWSSVYLKQEKYLKQVLTKFIKGDLRSQWIRVNLKSNRTNPCACKYRPDPIICRLCFHCDGAAGLCKVPGLS